LLWEKIGYNKRDFSLWKEIEMKVSYTLDIKKLMNDLRGPKGVSALTEELNKLSSEINKIKAQVKPQAHAKLKEAEVKYAALVKKLHTAQKDLDKEVTKRIAVVKKHAKDGEKILNQYKKLALQQKTKFKAAFTKKKASPRKPAKRARKTTTARTSSKKAAARA
jgi:hypothetical protein